MPAELLAQTESSIESPGEEMISLPILLLNVHEHCNCGCLSAVMEVDGSVRPCFLHGKIGNVRE
jgi:hypothetical protein